MVSIQGRLLIKSGLWCRVYGILFKPERQVYKIEPFLEKAVIQYPLIDTPYFILHHVANSNCKTQWIKSVYEFLLKLSYLKSFNLIFQIRTFWRNTY